MSEATTTQLRTWMIRSGSLRATVRAVDQWEAWDGWRDRPAVEFGLIALAEPDESADPIPVHTATLMRRWGRDVEGLLFDARARELGLL